MEHFKCIKGIAKLVTSFKTVWYFHLSLCLLVSPADLITFANSLDPDEARRFDGPDLDPHCLTLILMGFFSEKGYLKQNQQTTKTRKIAQHAEN